MSRFEGIVGVGGWRCALNALGVGALWGIMDCRGGVGDYEVGFGVRDEGIGEYHLILLPVLDWRERKTEVSILEGMRASRHVR